MICFNCCLRKFGHSTDDIFYWNRKIKILYVYQLCIPCRMLLPDKWNFTSYKNYHTTGHEWWFWFLKSISKVSFLISTQQGSSWQGVILCPEGFPPQFRERERCQTLISKLQISILTQKSITLRDRYKYRASPLPFHKKKQKKKHQEWHKKLKRME